MNALIRNHKNILRNTGSGSLYRKSNPSFRPYSQNHLQIYKKPNIFFKQYGYHPAVATGLFHHDFRHISTTRSLFEQQGSKPSSKVEQTVQTIKNKQKEQAEQVLNQKITDIIDPQPVATKAAVTIPVKKSLRTRIWEEMVHYYHGFRLLFIDANISRKLIWRVLNGKKLTRRENRLLLRTTSDLFRLLPFSLFIIIPFMELCLPLFIKFFPGMLPSTFQTSKEREDKLKTSLQVKLEVAKFLQKTLDEMAVQNRGEDNKSEEAKQFSEFFRKIKDPNQYVTNEEIIKFSKRFEDEITLDSLSREQLVGLCKILDIQTFATTNILRFQLHMKLRSLAADDHVIHREGVDSLDVIELQQACKARGMRAYGMTQENLRKQLGQWIDLSLNEKVPPTLLLLSRALMVSENIPTSELLKETIRSLPDALGAQTKAAIGELEGKIDNKTKIEVIKEEERRIKEELEEEKAVEKEQKAKEEEVLVDKAKVIGDTPIVTPAPEPVVISKAATEESSSISSKDAEWIGEALESVSNDKKTLLVEKETIKELREEIQEYQEDLEELREVRAISKEKVGESRAAKILFKKVNTMIDQLDKVLHDFEGKKGDKDQKTPVINEDLVKIEDLLNAARKLKTTSDESKLKTIENVLSKIDVDRDGHVKVDDILKVIEAIGRDNVKLNQTQIDELIDILGKEEIIETEDKIEKAIAKSLKEALKNEELVDKAPIITDSGKEFKAEPMAPPEPVLKDTAPTSTASTTDVSSKIPPTIPSSNAAKATKDKSV